MRSCTIIRTKVMNARQPPAEKLEMLFSLFCGSDNETVMTLVTKHMLT